jgi:hypothetical protein
MPEVVFSSGETVQYIIDLFLAALMSGQFSGQSTS